MPKHIDDNQKERLQKTIKVPRPPRVTTGTTFSVHDVEKSTKKLPSRSSSEEIVFERCGSIVPEAHSTFTYTPFERVSNDYPVCNGFIAAVHTAFSQHYPLVFSPDSIWLCIIQGLSSHINANAEKLRQHFVEFEGKKDLEILMSIHFVKGSPSNPWEIVFEKFSQGIRKHIGDKTHRLLTPEFSTTTPVERATSQIVLMDCFKQYFNYILICICGIPSITLEGTVEDWKRLRERALSLRQYDLDWWIDELEPVLDQFVAAASGNVDKTFWISIYKLQQSYDTVYINGWIVTLFPYLKDSVRNEYLGLWKRDSFKEKPDSNKTKERDDLSKLTTSSFSSGVVSVPFEWIAVPEQKQYPMQFFAGFMAATQNPDTLAIYPEQGWAVADRKEIDASSEKKKQHDMLQY